MTLDPAVFKAYDVRGTWPDQIDADGARQLGFAYATWLGGDRIAVGRDMRTMAPEIQTALISGITSCGVDVIDIGMVATEVLYHTVASMDLAGGIQITASHNPREYIGAKIVQRGARPVGEASGLREIRDVALGSMPEPESSPGSVEQVDAFSSFIDKAWTFIDAGAITPLTVVLDAGNGLGGRMIEPLLSRLPMLTVYRNNFEPDGTFPNHEPNPLLPENRQFIIDRVREHGANLGIAWDGDADRCFFIDETGEFVPGDFITTLLAEAALRSAPGASILYDVRASRAVVDRIEAAGGTAIASRVGHAFIKQRMREEGAVFAGEVSGHYYFREFWGVDTGLVPALMLLQLVSEAGGSLADLLGPLRERYHLSGEINSRVDDVDAAMERITAAYADARITHIDGINVDYDDWHFNVRSSNTEPLLRLNLEAYDQATMEKRRDEVLALIRQDATTPVGAGA